MKYVPVNNFRCKQCGVIAVSLSVHDFVQCKCGYFIDGGFDYIRRAGNVDDMEIMPLYWKKDSK